MKSNSENYKAMKDAVSDDFNEMRLMLSSIEDGIAKVPPAKQIHFYRALKNAIFECNIDVARFNNPTKTTTT